MDDLLATAMTLARAAGARLLEFYGGDLDIALKSSEFDLVTQADKTSEALILGELRARYPDHAFLAEESGASATTSEWQWVVDPLDGTTNFASGFPHFCVSIGLRHRDETVLGVLFDPLRDELFWAERGTGAWLESPRTGRQRLAVRQTTRLEESVLATGFAYSRASTETNNLAEFTRLIRRIRGIRRAGSAALDIAYVAAGRLDGYWEYHMQAWDTTAASLLVTEAGGTLATLSGEPWTPFTISTVAASPVLMPVLLAALRGE